MKRNQINHLLNETQQSYSNLTDSKSQVIKDNLNKSGVYLWTNTITQDIYVGSSMDLGLRLRDYFKVSYISNPNRANSIIHKALLKYGYANFQLEILEYCDISMCIEREQYYLDLLNPKYNILKKAGSSLGYKHTLETLETKMRPFLNLHNAAKRLPVELLDIETNLITKYDSITATAEALNTNEKNVRYAAKHNKLLLKKYQVTILRGI